ncbi:MAG TPA: hypothetical protein DEA08_25590 [Planctomycetes bacterium]|nr:hypothetical protein [Planctomycetota bacterium]
MKRAVLLDVFGTLVHFGIKRRPFVTLMRNLDRNREGLLRARRRLMTSPVPSLRAAAEFLDEKPAEADIQAAERELEEHLASCHLAEGTLPLLRQLRGEGFALALISNLASAYVPVLRRLGVHQLVDEATYSCEVGVVKPDPAIYGLTLEKLGVAPQNATMVGNSIRADVLGAKAAGLRAVWITENDDPAHVCLRGLADLRSVLP